MAAQRRALCAEVLCGFAPLEATLQALAERFGDVATFHVDEHGGDVIGVKWLPAACLPLPFRVKTAHLTRPCAVDGTTLYVPDVAAILQDVQTLVAGLVADVILNC